MGFSDPEIAGTVCPHEVIDYREIQMFVARLLAYVAGTVKNSWVLPISRLDRRTRY
jgi:hypothetical protein